jgi:hypothetical protein
MDLLFPSIRAASISLPHCLRIIQTSTSTNYHAREMPSETASICWGLMHNSFPHASGGCERGIDQVRLEGL